MDTAGYDFEKFRKDRRARQLVERNLEILSEASRRLPKELKDLAAHIPWRAVAGIGNILRHLVTSLTVGCRSSPDQECRK